MRENWTYKKLGEVGTFTSGYTPKASELSDSGVLPYFKVSDMNTRGNEVYMSITKQYLTALQKSYPRGAIVFPKNGAAIGTNKKRILSQDSVVDLNTGVFIPNSEWDVRFAHLWFTCVDFKHHTRGGALPTLDIKGLKELNVPVPSIPEQEAIVKELDIIHVILDKKNEQLRELDNLAQAIFYDMFGDPTTNEKGWEVKKLGEVATIVGGSTPKTTEPANWVGNNAWVTPAELKEEKYLFKTDRTISDEAASHLELMPTGTVLLSSRAPIGKLAITRIPMYCNQGFKNVVCGDLLNNEFTYWYLLLNVPRLQEMGVGATFKEISKSAVQKFGIYLPPLPLQQEFAKRIEAIERQKELLRRSITETETLLAARMQYYFE